MKIRNIKACFFVLIQCFIVSTAIADPAKNDHLIMLVNADSLTVKTGNGTFAVPGDRVTAVDAGNGNKLEITYDLKAAVITVKEICGSTSPVDIEVEVLQVVVTVDPCKEKNILLSTADEGTQVLDTLEKLQSDENLDDLREPMTDFQ